MLSVTLQSVSRLQPTPSQTWPELPNTWLLLMSCGFMWHRLTCESPGVRALDFTASLVIFSFHWPLFSGNHFSIHRDLPIVDVHTHSQRRSFYVKSYIFIVFETEIWKQTEMTFLWLFSQQKQTYIFPVF